MEFSRITDKQQSITNQEYLEPQFILNLLCAAYCLLLNCWGQRTICWKFGHLLRVCVCVCVYLDDFWRTKKPCGKNLCILLYIISHCLRIILLLL